MIGVFDAKYQYNFWRPVTAIRNGDTDGNDATRARRRWAPLIDNDCTPSIRAATASSPPRWVG